MRFQKIRQKAIRFAMFLVLATLAVAFTGCPLAAGSWFGQGADAFIEEVTPL